MRVQHRPELPATWVLVDEVLEEITRLHERDELVGTGNAKVILREIMDSRPFERMSAKGVPNVLLIEGRLGLDSPTDHSLLSLAISLTKKTPVTRVLILTSDTGLQLEIASQRRERGHRVFSDPFELRADFEKKMVADYLLHEHRIGRTI